MGELGKRMIRTLMTYPIESEEVACPEPLVSLCEHIAQNLNAISSILLKHLKYVY